MSTYLPNEINNLLLIGERYVWLVHEKAIFR